MKELYFNIQGYTYTNYITFETETPLTNAIIQTVYSVVTLYTDKQKRNRLGFQIIFPHNFTEDENIQ